MVQGRELDGDIQAYESHSADVATGSGVTEWL